MLTACLQHGSTPRFLGRILFLCGFRSFGTFRSVSAQTGKDPARMEAICKLLEATAFPNEGYFAMRNGVGINGRTVKPVGDRWYINYMENTLGYKQNTSLSMANYGKFVNSYAPEANVVWGPTALPDSVALRSLEMSEVVTNLPRHDNDYQYLLRLDTQLIAECTASAEEFMINYVLRKTDDYERLYLLIRENPQQRRKRH